MSNWVPIKCTEMNGILGIWQEKYKFVFVSHLFLDYLELVL